MMRVGKRGLNLAANAAVTAAAKVRWGQTQAPRTPPCLFHAPGQAPFCLPCPWGSASPRLCDFHSPGQISHLSKGIVCGDASLSVLL